MKKFLRNLALVCATLFAYQTANSQTVAVTADLKTMFGGAAATKTQVCLSLVDGNGNQLSNPRTSGGVIVPTATQCVLPDGSGHVATTAIANDQITPSGSVYSVTYLYNGRSVHGDTYQFLLADGTENLNTKAGIAVAPIVPTPTGDNTYLRLDGGNTPTAGINFGLFTDIFGIEKITETAAPTCVVGFDLLWGDSTAHRLKECDNNGSPVQIVHSGGDVNTSDQVTVTHLAAPLPTNQGGTGQNSSATFPTSGTVARTSGDTFTSTTLISPVVNGTPTGTGIPTTILKTGDGLGNKTTSSTSYVRVDSTNLVSTVTVPTGWKLIISASGSAFSSTAVAQIGIALADGSADNTGILIETLAVSPVTSAATSWAINNYVLTGDGASHTINLQFKTFVGADAANIQNNTSTVKPMLTLFLTPSN